MIIESNSSDDKYIATYDNGKSIKIPSHMFPLNREPKMFTSENTFELLDETIEHAFNSLNPRIGKCCYNSIDLIRVLTLSGVNAHRMKSYVGWLFIGETLPSHQAFIVIDDKHILDTGLSKCYSFFYEDQITSFDNAKEKFLKTIVDNHEKPNTTNYTFGKIPNYVAYVASECSPELGMKIRTKLDSAFPKHISVAATDQFGRTGFQK